VLGELGVEVAAGLIVAGLLALAAILRSHPRRKRIESWIKPRICRHDWRAIETDLGGGLILVTQYTEQCRKCGEKR